MFTTKNKQDIQCYIQFKRLCLKYENTLGSFWPRTTFTLTPCDVERPNFVILYDKGISFQLVFKVDSINEELKILTFIFPG